MALLNRAVDPKNGNFLSIAADIESTEQAATDFAQFGI